MQEDCQEVASCCCWLKTGKPGVAADPGTGHALIDRAPSHRPWSRQAEPAAINLFQKDPLIHRGNQPGPGASQGH